VDINDTWDGIERRITERRQNFCACHSKHVDILRDHERRLENIVEDKVSNRLFFWVLGAALLCFAWIFGTHIMAMFSFNKTQLEIHEKINIVAADVAVLKSQICELKKRDAKTD